MPNGGPPKKQKKGKKDDALPLLDGLLADSEGVASQHQPHDLELGDSAAAVQQAALHLLESLLQVRNCKIKCQHLHDTMLARLMLVNIRHSSRPLT